MSALRPFLGNLRFASGSRSATVIRDGNGWRMADARALTGRELIPHVVRELGVTESIETVISFEGSANLLGRIRDGGGPRGSWVVDYEAPNEQFGAIEDSIASALAALLEYLEAEDPPDSQ